MSNRQEVWLHTNIYKGTGYNKFVRRGPTLSGVRGRGGGGGGGIEDTTCLIINITDKTLLPLKFELTQKYSDSKIQHCKINEKSEV